jgi:hypothetical protein
LATVTFSGLLGPIISPTMEMIDVSKNDVVLPLSTIATSLTFSIYTKRGNVLALEQVPESACMEIWSSDSPVWSSTYLVCSSDSCSKLSSSSIAISGI